MGERRTWTFPELREAARLVESGQTWDEVAEALGCNESTLRTLMRLHGCYPDLSKRPKREHKHADKIRAAIRLRNTERLSWGILAERVGWPSKPQALAKACRAHARHHGWNVAKGLPDVRRTRWGTVAYRERS